MTARTAYSLGLLFSVALVFPATIVIASSIATQVLAGGAGGNAGGNGGQGGTGGFGGAGGQGGGDPNWGGESNPENSGGAGLGFGSTQGGGGGGAGLIGGPGGPGIQGGAGGGGGQHGTVNLGVPLTSSPAPSEGRPGDPSGAVTGADGGGGGAGGFGAVITGNIVGGTSGAVSVSGAAGGTGGDTAATNIGVGGGGGGGGLGLLFMRTVENFEIDSTVSGAAGGDGGDRIDGGGGGGGGEGVVFADSADALVFSTQVTAGRGGAGGDGGTSALYGLGGHAGGGGNGGTGAAFHGTVNGVRFDAGVTGGAGGVGGQGGDGASGGIIENNAGAGGRGGVGGTGGAGAEFHQVANDITVNTTLSGGAGGAGGQGGAGITGNDGADGAGGAGGAGIGFLGGGTITIEGAVIGGAGGAGAGNAADGAGGVGIVGSDLSIVNLGAISGGLDGGGTTRADAITFAGGANRLELQAGSTIIGNVDATAGLNDTLVLGGDIDPASALDLSDIVPTVAPGSTDQYVGFEQFEKTGASTWRLAGTGAQNWSIYDGTLIGNAGSLGGDLNFVTGAGTRGVVFDQTTDGAYAGVISGDGNFTLRGGSSLALTNVQGYTGTTTISAGTLQMGVANALASSAGIQLNAGTWDLNDYDQTVKGLGGSSGTRTTLGAATLTVDNVVNATYRGVVSGSGGLTKTGPAVFDFFGDNTYFGPTYVEGGLLRIAGGIRNSSAINISNGAWLDVITANVLSPTVAVNLAGPGSWFSVTTDQQIGSLDGEAGTLVWLNPGRTLTVGTSNTDAVFSGELGFNGEGALTKVGTGSFTLNDMNGYTGATLVDAGSLIVNGSIASSSGVAVAAGGTLGGSGTVSTTTIASGGTLAPGSSIGTLTVDGDLTMSDGAILNFEFGSPGATAPAGTSDRIDVAEHLTLEGMLNMDQSADMANGMAGIGYYRLMTYGGDLTGNGLVIGDTSAFSGDSDFEIQAGSGNVDLFVGTLGDDELQHWQGGDGVWNATNTQWLNQNGDVPVVWAGNHAAFKNQPGGFSGGTVTVDGTQSFTGLQFVDDGYQLQGSGALETLAGGSEIRVLADNAEISTEITGTGGITKTQDGTLVLSGANTYQGGTTIAAGTLQVSEDDNLGATNGGLTLAGGTLATTADMAGARTVTLDAAGRFAVAAGTTLDLSGTIAGSGDLIKDGEGALVLSGDNAYGNTQVAAGELIGDVGSISGNIANAGTVTFDQATNGTYAGTISGLGGTNGGMVKDGAGTLTLDGASALDWSITAGGLSTAAERFAGNADIAAGALLSFTDASEATYAGALSGAGLFALDGEGTVVLTGDSSGFAGTTAINAGTLLVGNADGNGMLGGSLDVLDGATLGGAGTVGSGAGSAVTITSGGTLAPGNSISTLTVEGDLVLDAGSRFEVEVNPEGSDSDLVAVTGDATLNGGAVAHIGANGEYDLRSTYTILSADGTLSGTFDEVFSDFAFLTPELIYDHAGGTVDIELTRNDTGFASPARTPNQTATAVGIESIGLTVGHAVYDAIAQLPDDEHLIRASFDQLSGEIHASARTALIEDSRFIRNAANDRIRAAFDNAAASVTPVLAYGPDAAPALVAADHDGPVFWSQGFGSWGSTDSDGNAASLDHSTGGLLVGTDTLVGDWRVGVLAGYSQSNVDADDRAASASSDNYHLGLYGGTQWGDVAFRTGAAYSWHDIDTRRSVSIPGLTDSLSADYGAGTFQVFGELGYSIDLDQNTRLEPFVNLAHVNLHTDNFTEQDGAAALSVDAGTTDVTFTTLGVRGEHAVTLGTANATLTGMIGWRHAFGDVTPESTHAFAAGDAFTVSGVPIARDSAVIEAGLDLDITPDATFGLSYQSQIASDARDHGFKANLSVRF